MVKNRILLETPVFDAACALKAVSYGVDRLELCSSYSDGGLTPGAGLLTFLRSKIEIPINVMIRPRGGDFMSSAEEIEVMRYEIRQLTSIGADGFVFGVLNEDGSVNKKACTSLISEAGDKSCTFHRAFDVSNNLEQSLEDIIECGFERVLTSGGRPSVKEGLSTLIRLLNQAQDRISIMPGGGMEPDFIQPLRDSGYLRDVHASCKKIKKASGRFVNKHLQFTINGLEADEYLAVDKKKVDQFKRVL